MSPYKNKHARRCERVVKTVIEIISVSIFSEAQHQVPVCCSYQSFPDPGSPPVQTKMEGTDRGSVGLASLWID